MPAAAIPTDEGQRLESLGRYDLLDTPPEPQFDRIVNLAAHACGTPIALFSLVDKDRQWFKARLGLDVGETSRDVSFCAHAVASDELLVVDDASKDARFVDNALVLSKPGVRFYAGAPVHGHDAQPLGTLCVIDLVPRSLTYDQRLILEELANEIEAQLEIRRLANIERELVEEKTILTNMVLHDVAGVLTVLGWHIEKLRRQIEDGAEIDFLEEARTELVRLSQSLSRISEGSASGLRVDLEKFQLKTWLVKVARRGKALFDRFGIELETRFDVADIEIESDADLLLRMLSNLFDNAIRVLSPGGKVVLTVELIGDDRLRLTVEDDGPGVALEDVDRIFEPYFSAYPAGIKSSGLGLSMCHLGARSLGGTIEYRPRRPHGACFVITVPHSTQDSAWSS